MVIDFHTHIFPDKIAAAAVGKLQQAGQIPAHTSGSAGELLASMAEAGVDKSVLLPVATNPMKLSSMNRAALERMEQPQFISFGAMHPDAPDWREELRRLSDAGIKGIKIHPVYQGVDIDDIRYLRILDRAAELGLITVTHAGADIGFPGVVHCSPEMIRHALTQLGHIPLVLAHMGGWKNWDRVADQLGDTGVYLDTSFSLGTLTPLSPGKYTPAELQLLSQEAFCNLVRSFGPERILFGTDSPWASQAAALAALRAVPLDASELAAMEAGNALRLLKLPF